MAAKAARRALVRAIKRYTKPSKIERLDRRSAEWRRMQNIRDGLMDHLGGAPSPIQFALVDRVCTLTVLTEAFERRAFRENGGLMSERDQRAHLAYSNALSRALRTLGIKGAPQRVRSFAEIFAADAGPAEAAD